MENTSLRELANYLFEENKIDQANRYIKKSMEDANFYNSRIRNFQTSRVLPIIDRAYQEDRARQEKKMQVFLLIISILSLVLLSGLFVLFRQIRKVSATRKKISDMNEQLQINNQILADTNKALTDTSQIKEEYIGRFLGLCSVYIEKMEKYRKCLLNQAKSGKAEDLYKMIRSTQFIEDERTEFYNTFDDSFLNLFPDFVERFNALLPEEEKVILKPNEKLTTGLRIFALIRLGITDSTKIAEFLNCSLATIYNYRSRYRNKALVPRDEFEDEIIKIGAEK
ncbi:MAG: helix-turn-helix domain-containing protein [Tannerellaceae bacterium]|nr:helix-turn-helix domain-containing protein [Tannerellaceae bacterium]